jgi:hypothetical protein
VNDFPLSGRGLPLVFLDSHVADPAGSSLTPRATIRSAPSGSGRCSLKAWSGGAVIQVSASSGAERNGTNGLFGRRILVSGLTPKAQAGGKPTH